jgi:hypothetical protein
VALAKYIVTGDLPIRDAVTRQSVHKGDLVTLDDAPMPRTDEFGRSVRPLAATLISALIEQGAIKPAPKPKKDAAEKAEED